MEHLRKIYNNKRVFVTGHTGFKGGWLTSLLSYLGAQVQGYALSAEENSMYTAIKGDQLCFSTISDIRDRQQLQYSILKYQPDFIFHLAAQPLVLASYQDPVYTHEVNILGTAHLLEAVRSLEKACRVIIITTDKVYENKEWVYPYRESDSLGGYDPYSASKAGAELISASYRSSFFHPDSYETHNKSVATVRAGNVIGGGDWAENRIIPDTVRAILEGVSVPIRNPYAVRPWQHVLEALVGYLYLGKKMMEEPANKIYNSAWNFGPLYDENINVLQLVQKAVEVWGKGSLHQIQNDQMDSPHEAGLLKLDSTKAMRYLGWKPKWSGMESITQTIEWYKQVCLEKVDAKEVTFKQIASYLR